MAIKMYRLKITIKLADRSFQPVEHIVEAINKSVQPVLQKYAIILINIKEKRSYQSINHSARIGHFFIKWIKDFITVSKKNQLNIKHLCSNCDDPTQRLA